MANEIGVPNRLSARLRKLSLKFWVLTLTPQHRIMPAVQHFAALRRKMHRILREYG
jgi:hypothetical protein